MSQVRKLIVLSLVLTAIASVTAGCARRNVADLDELRAAIRKTQRLSYRYVYSEESFDEKVEVRGLIEDDFRYKAQLSLDNKVAMEEVVLDDALATRFNSEEALRRLLRPSVPESSRKVDSPVPVKDALLSRQWVLDSAGAPSLLPGAERRALGDDPIYDSLNVWTYLQELTRQHFVWQFEAQALDYREDEDPFPHPEDLFPNRDVKRYDYLRGDMPRKSDVSGANQRVPGANSFRKAVVYVEDGIIIRVDEFIDVKSRLPDLKRNYGVKLPNDEDEAIRVAMNAINRVLTGQGEEPIRVRRMTIELFDIGEPNKVELPANAMPGDLALLKNRGFVLAGATAAPES